MLKDYLNFQKRHKVMGSLFSREKYRLDVTFPLREQFREFIDEEYLSRYFQAEEKIHKHRWIICDGEVPALLRKPHQQKVYMLTVEEVLSYYQECCKREHQFEFAKNDDGKKILIIYYTNQPSSYIFSKPVAQVPTQVVMKD